MKIGFIHDYQPNIGGTTQCLIRMARALRRRGHRCKLIAHPMSFVKKLDEKNLEIIHVRKVKMAVMGYVPYTLTRVGKIVSLFNKGEIGLCHAHFALPYSVSSYLAKNICGVPYVVTLHGSDVHKFAGIHDLKAVIKLCLENAEAVTVVCDYLKKSLLKKVNIEKEIRVIPNFINTRVFRKRSGCEYLREEFNISKNAFVITHISNFARIKNTLIIPEIAKEIVKKHPHVVFLMVGKSLEAFGNVGYDLEKLKEKVKELKLERYFRFTGKREDVARILNISDVSLLTSFNEGMPLAILESLAVGVPVIAAKVGGIPEIIKQWFNGCLVNKQRIGEYVNYISKMIEDPELKIKLGKNGVGMVNEKYSEDLIISKYINLYEEIIGKNKQSENFIYK